jgi:hypothetical protein
MSGRTYCPLDAIWLNPKRNCKCVTHTGLEAWHGKPSGYDYHYCRCADCYYQHMRGVRPTMLPVRQTVVYEQAA